MSDSKVLVTGGAGFIGSHLVPVLAKAGYQVRVLDNLSPQIHGAITSGLDWLEGDNIEFIRGSVLNDEDLDAALKDVDKVVHLASETGTGQSMYRIAHYCDVNQQGTAKLLDRIVNDTDRKVRKFVLSSSRSVYGEGAYVSAQNGDEKRYYPKPRTAEQLVAARWDPECPTTGEILKAVPTRESDAIEPASIYAATKFAQEELVRIALASVGIEHTILRLQNVYGEGQSLKNPYTGILSIFSTKVRRGDDLPIYEDGHETRDFVHVEDVAGAIKAALESDGCRNSVFNVGSGQATSVLTMANLLNKCLGGSSEIVVTGEFRIGDIRHNMADITNLTQDLGYTPKISVEEGLKRFADWVLTQPLPEDQLAKASAELKQLNLMGQQETGNS